MSVEIDWNLLSTVTTGESLSATLVALLNKQLSSTTRPSFLGPITVTEFDFGTVAPEVEIKDVGDIWRAFEDDDAQSEDDGESGFSPGYEDGLGAQRRDSHTTRGGRTRDYGFGATSPSGDSLHINGRPMGNRLGKVANRKSYHEDGRHWDGRDGDGDEGEEGDAQSVMSGFSGMLSPRMSMTRMGVGIGLGSGMGVKLYGSLGGGAGPGGGSSVVGMGLSHAASGIMGPAFGNPSLYSASVTHTNRGNKQGNKRNSMHPTRRLRVEGGEEDPAAYSRGATPPLTPGEGLDSPYIPLEPIPPQPLPSLQILLRLSHNPNIHLTLLTSLQINYPSPMFMTLPLKLSITGFSLCADIVMAFNGPKGRLHMCVVDEHDPSTPFTPSPALTAPTSGVQSPSEGSTNGPHTPGTMIGSTVGMGLRGFTPMMTPGPLGGSFYTSMRDVEPVKPIGERLLPNLQIESEIGHSDVHVLRNVGKVEKFIADVLRKTLVDELVWPNYQTVAL